MKLHPCLSVYLLVVLIALTGDKSWAAPGDPSYVPLARPPVSNDARFGHAVAVWGDWIAVGAPFDDIAGRTDEGSVHLYRRSGSAWTLAASLNAPTQEAGAQFGYSVAMEDRFLVVGTPGSSTAGASNGCAYVFVRGEDGSWATQGALRTLAGGTGFRFGHDVDIDVLNFGHVVAVAGMEFDVNNESGGGLIDNAGAVEFFRSSDGTAFSFIGRLTAPVPTTFDRFGVSVSMNQGWLAVGMYGDDTLGENCGSAHLYSMKLGNTEMTFTRKATLRPSTPAPNQFFGYSVELDGHWLAVGNYGESAEVSNAGATQLYRIRPSINTSVYLDDIAIPVPQPNDFFGATVAMRDDTLAICAPQFELTGPQTRPGFVRVYRRDAGDSAIFSKTADILPPGAAVGAQVGVGLAVWGDSTIVGAPFQNSGGAAWVCGIPPLTPVIESSGSTIDGAFIELEESDERFVRGQTIPGFALLNNGAGNRWDANQSFLAVGVPSSRAVDVYRRGPDATWRALTRLRHLDLDFGRTVALDGIHLYVGAPKSITNEGRVHVYRHDGASDDFQPLAIIENPDDTTIRGFGEVIAADAGRVAIGPGPSFASIGVPPIYTFARQPDGSHPGTPLPTLPSDVAAVLPGFDLEWLPDALVVSSPNRSEGLETRDVDIFRANQSGAYFLWQSLAVDQPVGAQLFGDFNLVVAGDALLLRSVGDAPGQLVRKIFTPDGSGAFGLRGDASATGTALGDRYLALASGPVPLDATGINAVLYTRGGNGMTATSGVSLPAFDNYGSYYRPASADARTFFIASHFGVAQLTERTYIEYRLGDGLRYHVYGSSSASGPFTRLTSEPLPGPTVNVDLPLDGLFLYLSAVNGSGVESAPSAVVGPFDGTGMPVGILVR